MMYNGLILKLAAFDVFALFGVWYHAEWEFVDQLLWQIWALRLRAMPVRGAVNLDALYPSLIMIAACWLGALILATLRRQRQEKARENLRRFQEASEHARGIDHRLANVKITFGVPDRQTAPRDDTAEPLSWGLPPGVRRESLQ